MKTLNKSNLIIIKEYNSNNRVLIQEVFYSSAAAAVPRLQYYNYNVDGNSTKIK